MNWYTKHFAADRIHTIKGRNLPKRGILIYQNPTPDELDSLAQQTQTIRGILSDNSFFAWKELDGIHRQITEYSGISGIPVYAGVHDGQIHYITISDASQGTKWFENPDIRSAVLSNHGFMSLASPDFTKNMEGENKSINYFNEAIVGDWSQLPPQVYEDALDKIDQPSSSFYKGWE